MAMENTKETLDLWRRSAINMNKVADSIGNDDDPKAIRSRIMSSMYSRLADNISLSLEQDGVVLGE